MAGAQKLRYSKETSDALYAARSFRSSQGGGSSSGDASSSGRGTRSAHSEASRAPTNRTITSVRSAGRGQYDGSADAASADRNPNTARPVVDLKRANVDVSAAAWALARGDELPTALPTRPPPSKLGQAVKIGLNTFHVENFPNVSVYQFDVMIGNGVEKRGIVNKVWNSSEVQKAVGNFCLFDGNKLAWSGKPIDREIRLTIDLDAEYGKTPRHGKTDVHRIAIRQTNKVGFQQLMAYLKGQASFDNVILETINFADQLLRQTPGKKFSSIKRNFFETGASGKRFQLGSGVEAFKGIYQSLRLVHPGRLSVNLDVANGTFWVAQPLHQAAMQVCGARDPGDLTNQLQRGGEKSRAGKELKKLRKVHVLASHRGSNKDAYIVDRFVYQSAKTYKVQVTDPNGKEVEMTLYDFFSRKHNIRLTYPDLPVVKMTRGKNTVLPMECLSIEQNQRYSYKMDERQTANMIKFAVTAPPERWQAIEHGLKMLDWASDPVLKQYGVKISEKKTVVEGRLLTAPTVKFGTGDAKPGITGRWDLKAKKFLQPNPAPLKSWAVCVVNGRRGGKPDRSTVEKFITEFCKGYKNLGGRVENTQPAMNLAQGDDIGSAVTATWNAAGNQAQMRPQILFFILPDKGSVVYGRIKRSAECRYGVVSQCVQYAHALKCQPQYIANVCMKFNAKLGGVTCRAIGQKTANGHFNVPTMVIGADVSHSAPGIQAPSLAAITVSTDKFCTRYAALCQSNGYRVEMINTDIINTELKPMVQHWISNVGAGKVPHTIVYIRDGVSEGQFQHVLQQEVADMKALLKGADTNNTPKWIVLIAGKRHHVRFFPTERADRNGNANPGTLVESGVTHPFENDFYLQSHAAIKGTARPTHYSVLLNEPNMTNDQLQTMLYEHAYQYQRASTPISSHPAVYYAHLASNRCVSHDPKWFGSSDSPSGSTQQTSGSQSGGSAGRSGSSSGVPAEFEKLMPMPNQGGINTSMWYI